MSQRSSQAWTKRFQKGRMPRLQRGNRTTVSESFSMSLTALMKRSMSLGISSCRQPNLVSNKMEEIPAKGKHLGKCSKGSKTTPLPSTPSITEVPPTFKAKLVELGGHIWNGGLVLTATSEELDAFQQISDHLVDDGGEGRHFPQLQHFGVESAADSGPLRSWAKE